MSYESVSAAHVTSAAIGIVAGGLVLVVRKGTARHKLMGYTYVVAMAALNVSALLIFRLTGKFGPFHYAALMSGATLLAGFIPVFFRRPVGSWLQLHLQFMVWSYIGLLAATASEAAVRIPTTPFWPAVFVSSLMIFMVGGYVLARNNRRLLLAYGASDTQPRAPAHVPGVRVRGSLGATERRRWHS